MRLSIATRIFLVFAAVVSIFGAVSSFAVWRMHAVGADIRLVSEGYLPLTKVAAQLETFHKNKQRDTDRLIEEKDPRAQRILIKLARLYYPRIVREKLAQGGLLVTETRRLSGAKEKPFLDEIEGRLAEISRDYDVYDAEADTFFAALESTEAESSEVAPAPDERGKELKRTERRIDRSLRLLSHALEGRIQERVKEAQATERSSSWAIIGFSMAAIALGILATLLSQRLLSPIRPLTRAAVRIGDGDYTAQVPTRAANEVGVLARAFNQMAASLQARERELQEKQEELVLAEKLATVGRMAAQITHEIRNPLSSIGLNTELLAEELPAELPNAAEARRLCAAIGREVDRLADVTEDYLRFARLPKPELVREDVVALVRDLVAFVKPELDEAGIAVELDLPETLPAEVDENQLRQALLNLVRNSREAMAGGGTLKLAGRSDGDGIELSIHDSGPGVPPQALERIFDPFFTTKSGGTGLGLSLTQQIIAQHHGRVSCESGPTSGTTFTVHLPTPEYLA
ncbi:sensor histidine kinase [Vulgatibacter incomptus]|uniref:histidine kinase n=1 Tax=Vulgatibacter incomptus TaxID=1391653 RepID=A0A0K1PEF0_9BACT|nr:HAMP domain-containing sensor histidine kinase [Vulgatibacter incomptus]AKU91913.1 sensor histidine kinase [Vulgatibacter incomptus]